MGRGNWFPGNDLSKCRVVYIDYCDPEIDPDDCDAHQLQWQWVKDVIWECLPKSFNRINEFNDFPRHLRNGNRDDNPLAFNGLFTIWADGQGCSHHLGIGVTTNEGAPAFADLDKFADKFFGQLNEFLPLRCGVIF